jgi:hypothetical protein
MSRSYITPLSPSASVACRGTHLAYKHDPIVSSNSCVAPLNQVLCKICMMSDTANYIFLAIMVRELEP